MLGYSWSDFHIGVELEEAAVAVEIKSKVRNDGVVFSLDSDGWLSVDGNRFLSHTQDFALVGNGTLYWLSVDSQLHRRPPGGEWQYLGNNVTRFAVQGDELVYSLATDGWLRVNGIPVWSGTQDFSLSDSGTLYWLSTDGELYQRLPGEAWQNIGSRVRRFVVASDELVYSLATDGWLRINGTPVWTGTKDFSLTDNGTLHWLSMDDQLYERLPGNAWQNIGRNVSRYVVQGEELVYSLSLDGWLRINGTPVWTGTQDFSLSDNGTLFWLSTDGKLYQRLVGDSWKKIGDDILKFAVRADEIVLASTSEGSVTIDGSLV